VGKRLISQVSPAYPAKHRPRLSTVRRNFLYTKRELEALRVVTELAGLKTPDWLFATEEDRLAGVLYDKESWEDVILYTAGSVGSIGYDLDTKTLWELVAGRIWKKIDASALSSNKEYTHKQTIASSRWTIRHSLNKFPTVTTVLISDSGIKELVYGDVQFITAAYIEVSFTIPVTGEAYLT
jgi:hypothetical protein